MFDVIFLSGEDFLISAGPLYAASIVENHGYKVKVVPCVTMFNIEQIRQLVDKLVVHEKQVICLSLTFTRNKNAVNKIRLFVDLARQRFPNLKIIAGGVNSFFDKNNLPTDVQFLMGYSKEDAIIRVLNSHFGKIKFQPFNFLTHRINYGSLLPKGLKGFPMWLELSRGCVFNCAFCTFQERNSKSQFKSKEQIKSELEEFHSITGFDEVFVLCNTFNDNPKKIEELYYACEELSFVPKFFVFTRLDLFAVQTGVVKDFYRKYVKYTFFGVESMNPSTLKEIHKSSNVDRLKKSLLEFKEIRRPDAFSIGSIIVGLPHDSYDHHMEILKWFQETKAVDYLHYPALSINPKDVDNERDYSEIEKDPEKYGYSFISKHDRFGNAHWMRNDGYTSEAAHIDSMRIYSQIQNGVPFHYQMFMASRGIPITKGVSETFSKYNRKLVNTENGVLSDTFDIPELYDELHKYSQELFDGLMND